MIEIRFEYIVRKICRSCRQTGKREEKRKKKEKEDFFRSAGFGSHSKQSKTFLGKKIIFFPSKAMSCFSPFKNLIAHP